MSLQTGTRLGAYEILDPIGAGGERQQSYDASLDGQSFLMVQTEAGTNQLTSSQLVPGA